MGLATIINRAIDSKLGQLNTNMLCTVVQVIPHIELLPYYESSFQDGQSESRTKIQDPIVMENATFKVGDIVLVSFLQEVNEDGAIRKFDISDAVIIGKVQI